MASPTRPSPPPAGPSPLRRAALLVVAALAAVGLLGGCGSDGPGATASGATAADGTPTATGTVTVYAAASLKEAFTEAAEVFEQQNPGARVVLNFAASSTLARQLVEKAPADAFASADEANMQKVVDAGGIAGEPRTFATNSLEIVVAPGNPEGITELADLANPGLVYVSGGPDVPIGRYAGEVLGAAEVTVSPRSLETDVKAVVTKVTSGEADAAIVYATDVAAAGDAVEGVEIPAAVNVVASYPIGVTTEAANPTGAAAWVDFLLSTQGQAILASYGFGAP